MEQISRLINGVPWTKGDTKTLDDLSPRDQKRVLDWISKNIHYSGNGETISSYSLKHHMEGDIHLYTTNNQFKHAMSKQGYVPVDYNELNWEYTVSSDKDPYAVMMEKKRIEKEQKHKQYIAEHSDYHRILTVGESHNENHIISFDDKQRILLEDSARIIGIPPQSNRIAMISPLYINHIAEIMVEDTGIIYFDANKAAFCSVLEHCSQDRLMNLLGNIGEAIIVHRCHDDNGINHKWLSIAMMAPMSENNVADYIAVGTGFKSTRKQHPNVYNPNDTQNDIIWIDDYEKKVIRFELKGNVGSYAALQVKASTDGIHYILPDLLKRRYSVPLVYYPINNDFDMIVQKAPMVIPGVDFIDVREVDISAFEEFMYYWSLLSKLHQGQIKPIDVIDEARSLSALKNGLFATAIKMTTASYAMF